MGDEDKTTTLLDDLSANFSHAIHCNDDEKVIRLCNNEAKDHEGPLYSMTLHGSTVLHMACFLEKFDLANKLLDIVFRDSSFDEDEIYEKLSKPKNAWGNTILHDATTSDKIKAIEFVKKLLEKVPRLLEVRNKWGESPLLQSIRYGKSRMYNFLVGKVDTCCHIDYNLLLKRDDDMTILHMAILTRQFDVALDIAEKYPQLYHEQDGHKMTALQMLASSPTAFKSGNKLGPLRKLVYSIVSTKEQDTTTEVGMIGCKFPMIEEVRRLKKGNIDALKLAKILIEK